MPRLARISFALSLALALTRCSQPPPPPEPTPLTVTSDVEKVPADGKATLLISVTGAKTPVRLTATQGTWLDTGKGAATLSADGSLILVTCDSRLSPTCAARVKVNAVADDGATGSVFVNFQQLEVCAVTGDEDGNGKADCKDAVCVDQSCQLPNKAGTGTCDASGECVCSAGAAEICDDGQDNNCDGKVDCEDPTCANKRCELAAGVGGFCNAMKTCACPNKAEVCNDNVDNDCDGLVDCADPDCQPDGNKKGGTCDNRGNTCSPVINGVSSCNVCSPVGGVAEKNGETLCGDNVDNDCDGVKDCQDPDCADVACSNTGMLCNGDIRQCECPGGSVETTCDDLVDNDCDGLVDCADPDCRPTATEQHACKVYGKPTAGMTCNASGACVCSGNGGAPEAKETSCGDGFDNDCDGFVDCQDTDCRPAGTAAGKDCSNPVGTPPTVGMKCDSVGQCSCPNGQSTETLCGDNVDNDCDGLLDCQDPDCNGLSCGAFGQECVFGTRTCTCPGGTVEMCGDLVDNNCNGRVDCDEPNGACAMAQCNSNPNYVCTLTGQAYVCKDITTNVVLTMTAASTRIAANNTSTSTITLTLKDGNTALANKQVTLAVTSGAGTVSPATVVTNGQGQATAVYTAGTAGGFNVITATYNTGSQNVTGTVAIETPAVGQVKFDSQQYSLMGVRYSSFQEVNEITYQVLDTANQPYPKDLTVNFTHTPAGGSWIGSSAANCTQSTCTATGVTDGQGKVRVQLHSGTVTSVVSVVATASAGGGAGNATASNIAIVGAKASGSNISISCTPRNVPAFAVNDCITSQVQATINCTAAFADRFGNILGVGTIASFKSEAGAATATSQSDPKTGLAKVGVSVQGFPLPVDVAPIAGEFSLNYDSGCGVKVHNPRDGLATIIVSANGEEGFVDGSNGKPANGQYDPGENFIDMGEPYVDANDNGIRDANEAYVDVNNNGTWDGPNGQWDNNTIIWAETRVLYTGRAAFSGNSLSRWFYPTGAPPPVGGTAQPTFAVNSTKAAGGATTAVLGVYFADKNLNELNAATTYNVSVVSGNVTAKFTDVPTVVDNLGMNFTQQYCSATTGDTCSNTCQSAPCYVVTTVNNFAHGNYGEVEIKGGSDASAAEVRASSTYGGVSTQISVTGSVSN